MNPIVSFLLMLAILAWTIFIGVHLMRTSPLAKLLKKIGTDYPALSLEGAPKRRRAVLKSTNRSEWYNGADISVNSIGLYIVHIFLFRSFYKNAFIPWIFLRIERVSWMKIKIDIEGYGSLYLSARPSTIGAILNMAQDAAAAT